MAYGNARGVVQDAAGNVVTDVWIEVRKELPGFPLAGLIYSDVDGNDLLDNPFFCTSGEFQVFAIGGDYRFRAYKTGFDKTWRYVQIGTAQSADVNAYASAGFTWGSESATATPPSSNSIRFDNPDVTLAEHIYIDDQTLGGSDATSWLSSLSAGDWLLLSTGLGIEAGWPVISVTDAGDYFDVGIDQTEYAGPTGPISFGDTGFITVSQERAGPAGSAGAAAADITFDPAGNVGSTDVQAAIEELDAADLVAQNSLVGLNTQTGTSYTLVLSDAGKEVELSNAGAIVLTIPPDASVAFAINTVICLSQMGAGQVTVTPDTGVTLRARNGAKSGGQYAEMAIRKRGTDEWVLYGDTTT